MFTVVLPPSRSHSISGRPLSRLSMPVRRGRVLVVDDDALVVQAVRSTLHRQHEVVGTTRAQEALDRLFGGERFDLILCDVMMPEVTGLELYEQLAHGLPEQARRVVFMAAGAFTADAHTALAALSNPLLEKPFNLRQLRALMNERVQA